MIKPKSIGLVIRPDNLEEVDPILKAARAAGIEIAKGSDLDREQASVDKGTVLVVGPDAFKAFGENAWCKVGDHIAYARFAGKQVIDPETNEKVLVINDEDVVCVLKEGN